MCMYVYREKETKNDKCRYMRNGEYEKGVQEFFVLFLELFSKSEFTSK